MSLMIRKKITPADKQINLRKNGETVFEPGKEIYVVPIPDIEKENRN